MEPTEPIPKPKRPRGRPRRADAPRIPWPTIDAALVFGERRVDPKTGTESVRYPSLAVLAERHGISRTLIWRYASKSKVYERRKEARARTLARTDEKVIEKLSSSRALVTGDLVRVVDVFISAFERELSEGRVKTDSAADFDRLARLRELLLGRSDSRSELHGELSLSAIQERHRRLRAKVDGLTPALTGLGDGPPRELGDSELGEAQDDDGPVH